MAENSCTTKIRQDLIEIFRHLCLYKGVVIIEGHIIRYHVHMPVLRPPKLVISEFVGDLKSKLVDKHVSNGGFRIRYRLVVVVKEKKHNLNKVRKASLGAIEDEWAYSRCARPCFHGRLWLSSHGRLSLE
ncbi:transposase [Streptococcus himalayensis]